MRGDNINLVSGASRKIDELNEMFKEYKEISMNHAAEKASVVRSLGESEAMTDEERKAQMKFICDELEKQISAVESDTSLTSEEKEKKLQPLYEQLSIQIYFLEDYNNMTTTEKEQFQNEQLAQIDKQIAVEKEIKKNQMKCSIEAFVGYLKRMLALNYPKEDIYKAYSEILKLDLEDKELEQELKDAYYEEMKSKRLEEKFRYSRNGLLSLEDIINSQTALEEHLDEEMSISEIRKALDEARTNMDRDALNRAASLINNTIIDRQIKNDFQAEAAEIDALIRAREAEVVDVEDLPEPEPENITPDIPEMPTNVRRNLKLTWKTAVAAVVGIGLGVGVAMSFGSVGVIVMSAGAALANRYLGKKIAEARMQRLSGQAQVQDVQEMAPGLKGKIQKFRAYANSESGMRDLSWLMNSSILSGSVTSIANGIIKSNKSVTPEPTQNANPNPGSGTTTAVPEPNTVTIDKVYDSSSWAKQGINAENPLEYINAAEGSVVTKIQNGAALIEKNGVAQGWIPADGVNVGDLVSAAAKVGGRAR